MAAAGRVKDGVSFAITIGIKSSPASSPTSCLVSVRSFPTFEIGDFADAVVVGASFVPTP